MGWFPHTYPDDGLLYHGPGFRCLKAGAEVLAPTGKPFTHASIGGAIATRAIMADLRAGGEQLGGPAPFAKADRSRFLQALDTAIVRLARTAGAARQG